MKKLFMAMMAVLVVFALTACSGNGSSDGEVLVKSDAGNVTKEDLYKKLKKNGGAQVLQNMVFTKLLEANYDVSDQIDEQVKKAKDQFDDEDKSKSALQQQGFENEEQFRESLKPQLLMQKATTDGVEVSEKEMKDYYDKNKDQFTKVKVSHILVDKEKEAKSIKKELENGADFAELAKKQSTDKKSAEKGGDLGYITHDQMVQPFTEAAFKLKKGEISDPVKSQYGYHIIKMTGDKRVTPFKDVKDQIKDTLTQQKAKSPFEVLKELKKKENLEVKDDDFKDTFDIDKLQKQAQQQQMQQQLQQMQPGQ